MAALVDVVGVGHRYSDNIALRNVTVDFSAERCALVGVNGAGKSTLLAILSGALQPREGNVFIDGFNLYGRRDRRQCLPRVALMPQSLSLPGSITVLEAVSYLAWMRGMRSSEARMASRRALASVDLEARAEVRIRELSGGMRRRVALAQALAGEPDILLLDEPSTGLDPQQRRRMIEIVSTIQSAVVFSSHVMEDVEDVADRVAVIDNGSLVFVGGMSSLKDSAPPGTPESRRAEAGFLQLISGRTGA